MGPKDGYHHGNLRRALLDESLVVIGQKGIEGLSLREVASRVGVSNAAPYHHFADKTALVTALASEAFDLMDERMAQAQSAAGDDPLEQLLAIGMAYVEFATQRPDYYAAMTTAEINAPGTTSPATQPASDSTADTWGRLMRVVIACQESGALPAGDPTLYAVSLWSLVHGLAELWTTGALRTMPGATDGLAPLARRVISANLGGMEAAAHTDTGPWNPCDERTDHE